jgi:CHAD domain-containing protein
VPYAFQKNETVPDAVRRIMDEQIVRARDHLGAMQVHDARKRFKETRALIRLIRDPLGAQFDVENSWFRDAGRDLAAARDADAVLEALAKLDLPRGVRARAKRKLEARREAMPREELEGRVANVLDQLVVARSRVGLWPELSDSFDTIAGGLQRTYRDGRRAMREASTPEQFHEWRKRAKEHWYQVQILRHVWPEILEPYSVVLQKLSRTLGDHHDLVVLHSLIGNQPKLTRAIAARKTELEATARDLGRRVYADRPRAFLARMRNVWGAWRTS